MTTTISVIIPVYNEVNTITEIISRVQNSPLDKSIIIVNDASTDGTKERLQEISKNHPNIVILHHSKNQGKGAAIRTGLQNATGKIIIIQDADLEYDPKDYPKLIEPIQDERADVVFGSRFLGGPHRVLFFWHYLGNKFLTLLSNIMTNLNLSDMETGYKVFRGQIREKLKLKSNRFGFEPEFTAKVAHLGMRIYEVPISYSGRTYEEGKKITWKDGVLAIFSILWFRFFD